MKKTLGEILELSIEYLNKNGVPDALIETENLLCWALELSRTELYLLRNQSLSENDMALCRELLVKRAKRIPLSYITGVSEFYAIELEVNENCLIPRQETEIVVEETLKLSSTLKGKIKFLDIGCGCGNIAIALAKNTVDSCVYCVDISAAAVALTIRNSVLNNLCHKINVYRGDLFSPFRHEKIFYNSFEFIVSNPPYIPSESILELEPEVSAYEPHLALDGGEDGLLHYRRIALEARYFLKQSGYLVLEIGFNQADAVKKLLIESGFRDIKITKDLGGNDRVVHCKVSS